MTVKELLHQLPVLEKWGDLERPVQHLTEDSREVREGSVFVAIPGGTHDGIDFVPQALQRGATAIISEQIDRTQAPVGACVADARLALAQLSDTWFHSPSQHLELLGVTGTNGKTSVAHLLQHVLQKLKGPCGVVGTIGWRLGDEPHQPLVHTTPSSIALQEILASFVQRGAASATMEVSSHAIDQQRVASLQFAAGVLTNVTRDHQDYHASFGEYSATKAEWMHSLEARDGRLRAAYNLDDDVVRDIAAAHPGKSFSFGRSNRADLRIVSAHHDLTGNDIVVNWGMGDVAFRLPLPGSFQVANAAAALAVLSLIEVDLNAAIEALANVPAIPGRFEAVVSGSGGPVVIVDYAHTPEALDRLLKTCRELAAARLCVVFGCGGDRDRGKRAMMAQAVSQWADTIVLTSDNPRTEEPENILTEMEEGVPHGMDFHRLADRRQAIQLAIRQAAKEDLIVIAGKGHEDYQLIGEQRLKFDDRDEARNALSEYWG